MGRNLQRWMRSVCLGVFSSLLLDLQIWGKREGKRKKREKYPFLVLMLMFYVSLGYSCLSLEASIPWSLASCLWITWRHPEDLHTVQPLTFMWVTHSPADILPSSTLSFCNHLTAIFCWDDLQGTLNPVTFKISSGPMENSGILPMLNSGITAPLWLFLLTLLLPTSPLAHTFRVLRQAMLGSHMPPPIGKGSCVKIPRTFSPSSAWEAAPSWAWDCL